MRNNAEYLISLLGITAIGCVAVPINSLWSSQEMEYGLNSSSCKVVPSVPFPSSLFAHLLARSSFWTQIYSKCVGITLPMRTYKQFLWKVFMSSTFYSFFVLFQSLHWYALFFFLIPFFQRDSFRRPFCFSTCFIILWRHPERVEQNSKVSPNGTRRRCLDFVHFRVFYVFCIDYITFSCFQVFAFKFHILSLPCSFYSYSIFVSSINLYFLYFDLIGRFYFLYIIIFRLGKIKFSSFVFFFVFSRNLNWICCSQCGIKSPRWLLHHQIHTISKSGGAHPTKRWNHTDVRWDILLPCTWVNSQGNCFFSRFVVVSPGVCVLFKCSPISFVYFTTIWFFSSVFTGHSSFSRHCSMRCGTVFHSDWCTTLHHEEVELRRGIGHYTTRGHHSDHCSTHYDTRLVVESPLRSRVLSLLALVSFVGPFLLSIIASFFFFSLYPLHSPLSAIYSSRKTKTINYISVGGAPVPASQAVEIQAKIKHTVPAQVVQ